MNEYILKIKKYAKEKNVPIMQDDGINFLVEFIKTHNIHKILEIGTAIGYSAIMMTQVDQKIKVVSIERDEERYLEAVKNVNNLNLENRIELLYGDALDITIEERNFDLVFIDAAKGQNISFFEKYSLYLKDNGFIITDNISFHGLVEHPENIESRNLKQLVNKIQNYIEYLKDNNDFDTVFYEYGDGISVSEKK